MPLPLGLLVLALAGVAAGCAAPFEAFGPRPRIGGLEPLIHPRAAAVDVFVERLMPDGISPSAEPLPVAPDGPDNAAASAINPAPVVPAEPAVTVREAAAPPQADAPDDAVATDGTPDDSAADDAPATPKPPPAAERPPAYATMDFSGDAVVVRYGAMGLLGRFRHNFDAPPRVGAKLVVRTERGVELGEVLAPLGEAVPPPGEHECDPNCRRCITPKQMTQFLLDNGPEYTFYRDGRVLRAANHQDVVDQRHLDSSAREEMMYCRQQIREMNLPMKLVTVEHLLGGERIIFYFSSEHRVDFRELVRRLAAEYRTRIEMRQVGARDEARLVGDYERCGQRCCCQEYLKTLHPVSMRMAKTQKATLDPSKISGRCGRLMCCLRYEDEGYEDLKKKLPRKNIWVKTASVVGKVIDTHILTQLVRLWLVDGTQVSVNNEEILERNVNPPAMPQVDERPRREQRVKGPPRLLREVLAEKAQAEADRKAAEAAELPAVEAAGGELAAVGAEPMPDQARPDDVDEVGDDYADDADAGPDVEEADEAEEAVPSRPAGNVPSQQNQPRGQDRRPQGGQGQRQGQRPQGGQGQQRPQGQRPQGQQPQGQQGQGQQGQGGEGQGNKKRRRRRRHRGKGRQGGGGGGQGQGGAPSSPPPA